MKTKLNILEQEKIAKDMQEAEDRILERLKTRMGEMAKDVKLKEETLKDLKKKFG